MAAARVQSVDALRGLVMIVMALDHTREFFSNAAFQPEDLARTTAAYFFTRWVTHICAPVFMFTAGMGAYFWFQRGRTVGQLSRFLWTRGLWLVLLELTALRFATSFGLFHGMVLLTILWALGWSMVALAILVRIPIRVLAPLSIAVIALHNLADGISAARFGSWAWIWNVLHQPGVLTLGATPVLVAYPLVPWIFVMAAGFCFGQLFLRPDRRRITLRLGVAMTLAFLAIRALNVYGDPFRWSTKIPAMTVLSFLRCTKYPPSLDFLLMTLGPALILLAWFDGSEWRRTTPLIVYGRVPLFYFLLHFLVLHLLTVALAYFRYGHTDFMWQALPSMGGPSAGFPADYGYPLNVVYAVWISVVVALYPVCLWFSRLKERRREWWLSYL